MRDKMLTKRLIEDPVRMAHSCRMRAEEMHTIASNLRDPRAAAILTRQAEEWEKMARNAEQRFSSASAAAAD